MFWPHTKIPIYRDCLQQTTLNKTTDNNFHTHYILHSIYARDNLLRFDTTSFLQELKINGQYKYKNQLQSSDLTIVFIPDSMRYFKKNLSQTKVFSCFLSVIRSGREL